MQFPYFDCIWALESLLKLSIFTFTIRVFLVEIILTTFPLSSRCIDKILGLILFKSIADFANFRFNPTPFVVTFFDFPILPVFYVTFSQYFTSSFLPSTSCKVTTFTVTVTSALLSTNRPTLMVATSQSKLRMWFSYQRFFRFHVLKGDFPTSYHGFDITYLIYELSRILLISKLCVFFC